MIWGYHYFRKHPYNCLVIYYEMMCVYNVSCNVYLNLESLRVGWCCYLFQRVVCADYVNIEKDLKCDVERL